MKPLSVKKRKYIFNTLLLSAVSIFMRAISVSFNAFVSRLVGEETLGLITLVSSVYSFAVTVALSGVNLAAVRLTSHRLAVCEKNGLSARATRKCLRREMLGCALYSLIFGTLSAMCLFIFAEPIGSILLNDERTVTALKISASALPAISLSAALAGYFTGIRKIYKNAAISLWEQFVKISVTSAALILIAPKGVEYALLSVIGGAAIAEGGSLILSMLLYFFDKINTKGKKFETELPKRAFRRGAAIAIPIALGAYVRQGLVCAEHIAIPRGLRLYSGNAAGALSDYGVLHGMAFPIIFFPSSVIGAAAGLLVPELSEYSALGNKKGVKSIAEKTVFLTVCFAAAVSAAMTCFGGSLGEAIYSNASSGSYICAIAPLITIMYLDTTVDSVLKGIGCEVFCMRVNIIDAFCSLILVLTVIPKFGIWGYIACVYITELLNFVLSISKMIKETGSVVDIGNCLFAVVSAFVSCSLIRGLSAFVYIGSVWAELTACLLIYSVILLLKFKVSQGNIVQKGEREKKPCKGEFFGIQ